MPSTPPSPISRALKCRPSQRCEGQKGKRGARASFVRGAAMIASNTERVVAHRLACVPRTLHAATPQTVNARAVVSAVKRDGTLAPRWGPRRTGQGALLAHKNSPRSPPVLQGARPGARCAAARARRATPAARRTRFRCCLSLPTRADAPRGFGAARCGSGCTVPRRAATCAPWLRPIRRLSVADLRVRTLATQSSA